MEWGRSRLRGEGLYSPAYVPPVPPFPTVASVSRETASASTPPMLKHWREVKAQRPDTILFYRVGDFYEMFYQDAELAARVLEITLTSRGDGVPLAGVPVKAAAEYLRALVSAGHRVAICEQVEDPRLAKGLVRREVVETITPGALLVDGWIPGGRNNWIVAVQRGADGVGVAAVDLSTGEFVLETMSDAGVEEALTRLSPAEVVLAGGDVAPLPTSIVPPLVTSREAWEFDPDLAREELARRFALASLDGLGIGRRGRRGARRRRRAPPLPRRAATRRPSPSGPSGRAAERGLPLARRHDPEEPRAGRAASRRRTRVHAAREHRRHGDADGRPAAAPLAALAAP